MLSNFVVAGIIAVVYILLQFIYKRFIEKSTINTKAMITDLVLAFCSSLISLYLAEQLGGELGKKSTPAHIGKADF